jgi:hypothetical protein
MLDANRFRGGDLNVIDVTPIPDRFKDTVPNQKPLPQIWIDGTGCESLDLLGKLLPERFGGELDVGESDDRKLPR